MFNLLVKFQPWAEGRDTIPAGRVFEYTDSSLVDRSKPGGQLDVAALSSVPALFLQKNLRPAGSKDAGLALDV